MRCALVHITFDATALALLSKQHQKSVIIMATLAPKTTIDGISDFVRFFKKWKRLNLSGVNCLNSY